MSLVDSNMTIAVGELKMKQLWTITRVPLEMLNLLDSIIRFVKKPIYCRGDFHYTRWHQRSSASLENIHEIWTSFLMWCGCVSSAYLHDMPVLLVDWGPPLTVYSIPLSRSSAECVDVSLQKLGVRQQAMFHIFCTGPLLPYHTVLLSLVTVKGEQ